MKCPNLGNYRTILLFLILTAAIVTGQNDERGRSPSISQQQFNKPFINEPLSRTAKRSQFNDGTSTTGAIDLRKRRTTLRPLVASTSSQEETTTPLVHSRNTPRKVFVNPGENIEGTSTGGHIPFTQSPPKFSNHGTPQPETISGIHPKLPPVSKKQTTTTNTNRDPNYSCGEIITLKNIPFIIQSPGWSNKSKYPPNSTCLWTLKSPPEAIGTVIKIVVRQLDLEEEIECKYDYFEIQGHRKLCGRIENKEFRFNASSGGTDTISFVSDTNYEGRGFEVEVSSIVPGCKSIINTFPDGTGVITSPGFPNNYPDAMDCWTLIRVESQETPGMVSDRNVTITIAFEFINLEPDEKCSFDYVEIFDGMNSTTQSPGTHLGRYCEYNNLDEEKTSVPPDNINNAARISGAPTSANTPLVTATPSSNVQQLIVTSTRPEILVHFHSDQLLNSKGYKAKYKVESLERSSPDTCQWKQDHKLQTIQTPNHPNDYPPNLDCSLTINAPTSNDRIVLVFETFNLETDGNCSFDRLEIYDEHHVQEERGDEAEEEMTSVDTAVSFPTNSRTSGPMTTKVDHRAPLVKPVRIICGRKSAKFKHVSKGPSIKLRFVSDNFAEYPGFTARYFFAQSRTEGSPSSSRPTSTIKENDFEKAPSNTSVELRSSILLSCKPRRRIGNETIIWTHNGKVLNDGIYESGQKLLIREFTVSNAGRYVCQSSAGSQNFREAYLTAANVANCSIYFASRPKDMVKLEGESGVLECSAVLTPPKSGQTVEIEWLKDGKKIINDMKKIQIVSTGFMVINNLTREDSGIYFCVASVRNDPSTSDRFSTPESDCRKLSAAAHVTVNVRQNVDKICGRPVKGQPSKQKPSVDSYGKIVGGSDAQKGAFPWQVMFWDYKRRSFCGGALLNERWVVTAAHCFPPTVNSNNQPPPPEVRLGRYDQSVQDEDTQFVTKIAEIRRHPGFSKETFNNDICLIKLADHVKFTEFIQPICVGARDEVDELFFRQRTLKMGHVTGWGQLKESGPQPKFLQEIRLPIVTQSACKASTSFNVSDNMFCAGYAQEIVGDACKGDSGGPFVSVNEDRWYLLGIVSWGEGCGRTGKYGFYTKVNNYFDWIKNLIVL